MKQNYPRMLYLNGLDDEKTNVIVQDADEEQAHRAQGYRHHGETVKPDELVADRIADRKKSAESPQNVVKAPAKRGRKPKGA